MRKKVLIWTATAMMAVCAWLAAVYLRDMKLAYERVQQKGAVIESPFGDIEYTEGGSDLPVLVIHGSGGGYDQGELIARAVLGDGFRWITPSRFGYLRSTFRDGATWDEQAHAYAYLLDHLGIDRVAVVAMSQGGPSALLFALLHPERISSLTLVSCGVAPASTHEQVQADEKGRTLTSIFRSDLPYWAISWLFKKQFMELMGANDSVIDSMTAAQRELVERIIDYMNPASLRSAGVAFDNKAVMPGKRIAAIETPTLVLHAKDDTLQLYHNAEFAAATIPNVKLVSFDRGGHVVIAVEQTTIRAVTQAHILSHAESAR